MGLQAEPQEQPAAEPRRSPRKKAGGPLRWADEDAPEAHQEEEPPALEGGLLQQPPGLPLPVLVERGSSKREQRPSAGPPSTDAVRCVPACVHASFCSPVWICCSSASSFH